MKWHQTTVKDNHWSNPKFDSRICTEEDIGEELFIQKFLYICPPKTGLLLEGNRMQSNHSIFGFEVKMKHTSKEAVKLTNHMAIERF